MTRSNASLSFAVCSRGLSNFDWPRDHYVSHLYLYTHCENVESLKRIIFFLYFAERISSYTFLRPINQPSPSGYSSTPERFMAHASFLVGQRVSRPGAELTYESGYQVLRLSTELVPATLAVLGTEQVSPFWAVLFYFILILFGIAQQVCTFFMSSIPRSEKKKWK